MIKFFLEKFILLFFIVVFVGCGWHLHSTAKTTITALEEKNKQLQVENKRLTQAFYLEAEKYKQLTNDLLSISEEKNACYKKILKYHTQLKEVSIKRPHSIESRVNRYFVGVYNDVSSITGGNANKLRKK